MGKSLIMRWYPVYLVCFVLLMVVMTEITVKYLKKRVV